MLTGPIDLNSVMLSVTGDPMFDLFFTIMVYVGLVCLGWNAVMSFLD